MLCTVVLPLSILVLSASAPDCTDPEPILRLGFSMDGRDPFNQVHIEEEYALYASGRGYNVTHATNRGHLASHRFTLDAKAMGKVAALVNALPAPEKAVPLDVRVTVVVRGDAGKAEKLYFRRDALPREFAPLLELLGGLRNGMKGKLKYAPPDHDETPEND